jgi:hypothetical protein
MNLRLRSVLVAAVVALVGAACAEEETPPAASVSPSASPSVSEAPTGSPEPTESESPEPTESESPTESPSPELEDGRHFGDIVSIDVEDQTLVLDLAYFLTGDEANEAAEEHGDEVPVPNDYYIVNDNPKLRTLQVAPDVRLLVIDWGDCCELTEGEIQPFVDAFATEDHEWDSMYQGSMSWYWLTVEDGVVVEIEEQYLP